MTDVVAPEPREQQPGGGERAIEALVVSCGLALAIVMIALDVYTFAINETNHTGIPMSWLVALGAVGLFAAFGFRWKLRGSPGVARATAWLMAASIALIVNVIVLDVSNVMMTFERWAYKGMPERPW